MASHKILVIDDSVAVRKQVQEMLPRGNFEVLEAKNGEEGLRLIQQERPNLIMLDFVMPRKSGWEVYQQIQTQGDLRAIPLVVMSGLKTEVTEKIPEPFEYFEFIEKPFDQKQLVAAIKSAMVKAKKVPTTDPAPVATKPVVAAETSATSSGDIQALNEKITKMQAEIDMLKKQVAQIPQILAFIKQKLK